jgi:NADPH-dependent curcumin reductase
MVGPVGTTNGAALPSECLEIYLKARPEGMLESERDFGTRRVQLPNAQSLGKDDVLLRVLFASCDPAMRGWMSADSFYVPPVEIGAPMRAGGVGEVVASGSEQFAIGGLV